MHDTVSSALLNIANYQKDFVKSLRASDLRSLPVSRVADFLALPHHASIYCRLLRRRTVEIVTESSTTVIPVQLLLRGHDALKRYEVFRRLNDLLLLEVRNGHALSDRECAAFLARHIPGAVSRRRIAEYRDEANIPTASMRLREYANGRHEPFIIHCDWEIWLKKYRSEISDQSLNLG